MRIPERGACKKWFAAGTALSWAVFGLLWAQVIVLPNPLLLPRFVAEFLSEVPATTRPERFVVMIVKETSLMLCGFALLGLLLAAVAHRSGARGGSYVAALLCAATVAVSLAPVAGAGRSAAAEGVTLSLPEYFTSPAFATDRSLETVTYARPRGEELKLDVWWPPDAAAIEDADAVGKRPAVIVVHGGG